MIIWLKLLATGMVTSVYLTGPLLKGTTIVSHVEIAPRSSLASPGSGPLRYIVDPKRLITKH